MMSDKNLLLAEHETLETTRLFLRKLELSDAEEMFEYASDPMVARYTSFNPHDSLDTTKLTLANFFLPNRLTHWAMIEKTSGKLIGEITFHFINDKIVEFGWVLNRKFWGKGYAVEAGQALFALCFNFLGVEVIQAQHLVENKNSGRVMEKLGMTQLGQVYSYFPKFEKPVLTRYWALSKAEF